MLPIKILIIFWAILKLLQYFFAYKVKTAMHENSKSVDNRRALLSPSQIRSKITKISNKISVYFDSMKQSESLFDIGSLSLWFPIHGVNRYTFKHELGHALSVLEKKYKWIHFSGRNQLLRKVSSAIGSEYRFEKEAWIRSGYYNAGFVKKSLNGYRYLQMFNIFDFVSILLFLIIIFGILF